MDIELAIDVMDMSAHVNHIVILSGDGDFRRLVEAVQRKGVRVSVVSTIRSQPPMIADELRRQADNFVELVDIQEDIMRDPQYRQQREAMRAAADARRMDDRDRYAEEDRYRDDRMDEEDIDSMRD